MAICQKGFAALATLDDGFFGRGIYHIWICWGCIVDVKSWPNLFHIHSLPIYQNLSYYKSQTLVHTPDQSRASYLAVAANTASSSENNSPKLTTSILSAGFLSNEFWTFVYRLFITKHLVSFGGTLHHNGLLVEGNTKICRTHCLRTKWNNVDKLCYSRNSHSLWTSKHTHRMDEVNVENKYFNRNSTQHSSKLTSLSDNQL